MQPRPLGGERPSAQRQSGWRDRQVPETTRLRVALEAFQKSRLVSAEQNEILVREYELLSSGAAVAGLLMIVLDGVGRILWISQACEHITGYAAAELEGSRFHRTPLAQRGSEDFQDVVNQPSSAHGLQSFTSQGLAKDGRVLRIQWSLTSLPDESGAVEYLVAVGVDTSGREQAEQASQLEEMRLKSLLEISQKAADLSERDIIQHTLEEVVRLTQSDIGYLHFVNSDQESLHLFAWSEQSLKECTAAHDAHYPISKAGVWADCARLKEPVVHNDYQSLSTKRGYPEGHSHLVRHASIPILEGDRVVIILGVGNKTENYNEADVRQMLLAADGLWKIILRKRAEEELRQHVRALEEADRQKDEFLAMLAHELRNPLAPVGTALQILDQPSVGRDLIEEAGRIIGRQMKHMTRLVDDLLDVSRITRGKISLEKENLELVPIVDSAIEVNREFIEHRKHRLEVTYPASSPVVYGDRVRLTQIVSNLIHNAAKYMADSGEIGLAIEQVDGQALIRVADTGVGIAPAMLPRVFDLFVQADESLDRSQGGLGLGLTLVRQLVDLHGGTVEALSEGLYLGSQFVVRLPLVHDAPSQTNTDKAVPRTAGIPGNWRVLVVDDNKDAASMLQALLETMGYEAVCAHDGESALTVFESYRPEVVLLDIGLPKMDGYQVAEQIRRQTADQGPLLIALTGYGHEKAMQRSREAGFDHHLVKPFDPHALSDLLAKHKPA